MYDNICKFLAENFKEDLATWLLGSPIKLTELSPTELSNDPIRADSLILLQSDELTVRSLIFNPQDLIKPYRACNPGDSIDSSIFISYRAFAIL